jgi:multiple sugar transport system permease protein
MPIIIYMMTTGVISAFKFMPLGLFQTYSDAEAANVQTVVYYIFHAIRDTNNYGRGGAASIILMAVIILMTILNRFLTK